MSLDADLASPPARGGTNPCRFRQWTDSLQPAEAQAVYAALWRDRGDPLYWPAPALHKRLLASGYTGSEATVYSHRNATACQSCRP